MKKKVIKLEFDRKLYEIYKDDCEKNVGKKLSEKEVIKIMLEDLRLI